MQFFFYNMSIHQRVCPFRPMKEHKDPSCERLIPLIFSYLYNHKIIQLQQLSTYTKKAINNNTREFTSILIDD